MWRIENIYAEHSKIQKNIIKLTRSPVMRKAEGKFMLIIVNFENYK